MEMLFSFLLLVLTIGLIVFAIIRGNKVIKQQESGKVATRILWKSRKIESMPKDKNQLVAIENWRQERNEYLDGEDNA